MQYDGKRLPDGPINHNPTQEQIDKAYKRTDAQEIERLRADGWVFSYDPETGFIGMEHPCGGKQSVCELKNQHSKQMFGELMAAALNGVSYAG